MRAIIIGGFDTTMEACKSVGQEFANEISVQTMRQALNLACNWEAYVKKKKKLFFH